jgi:hypothetical protein
LLITFQDLGETEVSQADVTIFTHKDVLRLQVTVNDLLLMEMTDSQGDGKRVELGTLLRELPSLPEMSEELTTTDETHDEVELGVSLENVLHTDEERVVRLLEDLLLEHR